MSYGKGVIITGESVFTENTKPHFVSYGKGVIITGEPVFTENTKPHGMREDVCL